MAAVVRVKRLLEEEPSEAVLLNCKRRKLDNETTFETKQLSTVLKFAGTIENQEDDIFKHIKSSTKAEFESNYKKPNINFNEKVREDVFRNVKNNRYKVVNCFRSSNLNVKETDTNAENQLTVVDIEQTKDLLAPYSTEAKYVYDLYYTNSDDFGDADINEYVNVYPLSDDLIFGSARDNGCKDSDSEESDDSNDENNWRNDYPEESDHESITEEDMVEAVKRFTIDDDLSSDDGVENFTYGGDNEAAGFEDNIDLSDVQRYGKMYARFKARNGNTEETDHHNFYCTDDDNDDDDEEYD